MNLTPELAEVLGIFAADGSMQDNYICMWGNIKEDKEYYDTIVCPLFSKIFNKPIIAHEKKSNSVYGFYLCRKSAVEFLKSFGFSKRKTYTVKVPGDILNSENLSIYSAFVRGFADCDGYISFMKRKGKYREFKRKFHTYPRIGIKIVSKNMIEDLSYMLKKLKINHTVNVNKSKKLNLADLYSIEIRGNMRVEDYLMKVKFNNPAQHSKYEIWKKFGFCPCNTTIQQRRLILQGKIDPSSLYKNMNAPDRI
jgi:intein/homing endonuclease